MKRYLLFTGEINYSYGGMKDFLISCESLEDALQDLKKEILKLYDNSCTEQEFINNHFTGNWAHICDIATGRTVWDSFENNLG